MMNLFIHGNCQSSSDLWAHGCVWITGLHFAYDVVIFVESLDDLRNALLSLSEKVEPLGFRVYWAKTKS